MNDDHPAIPWDDIYAVLVEVAQGEPVHAAEVGHVFGVDGRAVARGLSGLADAGRVERSLCECYGAHLLWCPVATALTKEETL